MEIASIVTNQVIIMFILIILGYILAKAKIITQKGSKELSNLLVMIVTPCVLIKSYSVDFNADLAFGLAKCLLFSVVIHIVAIVVSNLAVRKGEGDRYKIERFSVVYCNCGFMAIPLLQAAFGNEGVFFGSAYLVVFTALSWSHGLYLYSGDKKTLSLAKIMTTPGMIGIIVGMILFLTGLRLPAPLFSAVDYMTGLNTPIAMILLGVFLADVDLKKAFLNVKLYIVSFLRLIVIPLIAIVIGRLMHMEENLLSAVIITASCPVATIAALFAAKYDLDTAYASETVAINTLISIVTIPVVVWLLNVIKF